MRPAISAFIVDFVTQARTIFIFDKLKSSQFGEFVRKTNTHRHGRPRNY
ncbi:protein of unknown function [Methylocaldum szegediense]|uniref:Uncharacterized protein n=1 Tax=Methylocaldum szegediense TaxID=73780 RepID=A0ABM9I4V3_9GAMM|nr:protein of unknown function [Methylocaldum szegediense]